MQPDPRSDQVLVEAVNRGELAAFDALYHRHRDWVHRLAYRFTRNHHDALEVFQETFTRLLARFPGFHLSSRLTTYLYPVVRHLSIDLIRRKRRQIAGGDDCLEAVAADESGPGDCARDDLGVVLEMLPESQREVLLMRFFDDMTLNEIAQALEIPTGTVKSRLHNALEALRADQRTREYFLP
jgi:RNA polymerase sigma-70 factor, ECF subfamily